MLEWTESISVGIWLQIKPFASSIERMTHQHETIKVSVMKTPNQKRKIKI
jgi:hypothetical protein